MQLRPSKLDDGDATVTRRDVIPTKADATSSRGPRHRDGEATQTRRHCDATPTRLRRDGHATLMTQKLAEVGQKLYRIMKYG